MGEIVSMRRAPRQARGRLRIESILDAADVVLAEVGYEAATTNAIAARAETSIGSLYQFFPNKEAIMRALGLRYVERMRETFTPLLSAPAAALPLDEHIERIVDALTRCQQDSPTFKVLFCSPLLSPDLAAADSVLHDGFVSGLDAVFAARRPDLDPARRTLMAHISVLTAEALMPLLVDPDGESHALARAELKALLLAYLRPTFG